MDFFKRYHRWNWERIRRHILYWLAWSMFFVIVNFGVGKVVDCETKDIGLLQWIAFESLVLPIKIASTYTIAYVLMPLYLYRKKYIRFLMTNILVLTFFSLLLYLVYRDIVYPIILENTGELELGAFIYKGIELIYFASLVVGIKFFQDYQYQRQLNQNLVHQKTEAELNYLKNQIQPHFLFNTLNNIYGMVLSKDKDAGEVIVKLSDILSYTLYECNVDYVTLDKEIAMLDNFIEIELLRYKRKVDLSISKCTIPDSLKIAPLLLIPFVENAFQHGPAKEDGRSIIDIDLELQNNIFHFSIKNSYPKELTLEPGTQSGIGLENIKKRLQLLYPDRHTLKIDKSEYFEVSLIMELSE